MENKFKLMIPAVAERIRKWSCMHSSYTVAIKGRRKWSCTCHIYRTSCISYSLHAFYLIQRSYTVNNKSFPFCYCNLKWDILPKEHMHVPNTQKRLKQYPCKFNLVYPQRSWLGFYRCFPIHPDWSSFHFLKRERDGQEDIERAERFRERKQKISFAFWELRDRNRLMRLTKWYLMKKMKYCEGIVFIYTWW